jgi:hypothetical protein
MTEQPFPEEPTAPSVAHTGDARVDDVLDSLAELGALPVDDHVGVFERAHEDLRRALSDAGEQR